MAVTLTFEGDLDGEAATQAVAAIDAASPKADRLIIEMGEADINDGRACAAMTGAIRRAAERFRDVVIVEGPQVLTHTLYRIGALERGAIRLVAPRDEIGGAG